MISGQCQHLFLLRLLALQIGVVVATPLSAEMPAIAACSTKTTAPGNVVAELDGYLRSLVDPDDSKAKTLGHAPGAVLSVQGPDWGYIKSAGWQETAKKSAIDCEMPFQIGSNTKMMTATVILQLQEEGALSLDDKLSKYLADTAAKFPKGDAITLRQLARHTAGLFNYTDDAPDGTPGIMAAGFKDPSAIVKGYSPQALVDFASAHGKSTFEPGEPGKWSYSNTGYVLLGQIIEQITGQKLADVFDKRIFGPLGMKQTYLLNDVPTKDLGLASSYWSAPFDIEATNWNLSQAWAAGAVISTPSDMTTFISGLLRGKLFKKPATLDAMKDTVVTGSPTMPAYGIGLIEKLPGVWGHGGQTMGFASDVAYSTKKDIALVVWTNAAKSGAALGTLYTITALNRAHLRK